VPEPVVAILPDVLIETSFASSAVPIASAAMSSAFKVSVATLLLLLLKMPLISLNVFLIFIVCYAKAM